jgi:cytosine/adenosine deaminase-related metal-dependent hydrolase
MPTTHIFSKYGLIGDNLDLKENITIELNGEGKISKINFEEPSEKLEVSPENQNLILIPGFINSHVHVGDNFAKENGFNKNLIEVVAPPYGLKHKLLRHTPDDIKILGIQNAVLEMISNGITSFIDFREGGVKGIDLIKNALKGSPINSIIFGRFVDESEIEDIFEIADGIGFASYDQITDLNKKWVREGKQKYNKLIACHCAEYTHKIHLIKKLFDDDIIDVIIHGTKFKKQELEKIKDKNKKLVICPRCNGYFGVGFPPITEIIKLNIPISLGTDNLMAINPDLFEEMRYLYRISRVLCSYDPKLQLTSKDLLKMVTINAARNFNLDPDIGSISEGKYADFFLIDLNGPNLFTHCLDAENIYPIIVQRTKSENIKKTYIKGEIVFERK